jgi:methyl-accepting chemotaxis protein
MEQVTQIQADQIRALNDTLNKITAMVLFTNNTIAQLNNTVSNLSGRVNQLEQTTNKQIVQINAIYDSLKLQRGWNLMQDQQIKSNTDSINKILSWKQYYKSPLMLTGPYGDTTIIDIPLLKSQLQ